MIEAGREPADRDGMRAARDRELFDRVAARYARKDLHPASRRARRQRLEQTLSGIVLPEAAHVVEIGCGAGFAAEYLRGRFASYHGIDHSETLVALARRQHGRAGVTFEAADALLAAPERPADLVFMIGVLHHLEDPSAMLGRAAGWLAPGGILAVNEPHPGNPAISLLRRARKRLDGDYSDEQCEMPRAALRSLFEEAGLAEVTLRPQGVLSTPFAEVVLSPRVVASALSRVACASDRALEAAAGPLLFPLSWNVVARGKRPGPSR